MKYSNFAFITSPTFCLDARSSPIQGSCHGLSQRRVISSPGSSHLTRRAHIRMVGSESDMKPGGDTIIEGPFQGHFGIWNLTQTDLDGVLTYRTSLAICAALSALGVGAYIGNVSITPRVYDALFFAAAIAFGVSLQTIHIYLKPMHNMLKGFWAAGIACSCVLAVSPLLSSGSLVSEVVMRPQLMLAVGWPFVALTGLFFKEAFCFGRAEAGALTILVPLLSAGHFLQILPAAAESIGAAAFASLFVVFAARKFQQPARDDLGDKSIFEHLERGGSL